MIRSNFFLCINYIPRSFFWCLNLLYTFPGISIILICRLMRNNGPTDPTTNVILSNIQKLNKYDKNMPKTFR